MTKKQKNRIMLGVVAYELAHKNKTGEELTGVQRLAVASQLIEEAKLTLSTSQAEELIAIYTPPAVVKEVTPDLEVLPPEGEPQS